MNKLPLCIAAAGLLFASQPLPAEETVIPRFDVSGIHLEGNSLLPAAETMELLKRYTGPGKDFGTIQEAIEALEAAYRERGYTLVTVLLPEQELQGGIVRLQVIEPRVTAIEVGGNRHVGRENVLASLPTLKSGQPPNVAEISENIRAVNENPAKKLALQFKSSDDPGRLTAAVKVDDRNPWRLTLTGDNTGTPESGRYRTGIQIQHANLWNRDHVAALQYTTSPDHLEEVKIFSGSYRIPFYARGDTLDLFAGYSDVDNGLIQNSFTMSGQGTVAGIRYNLGLPRHGRYEQKLMFGFDYRLYDNTLQSGTANWNALSPDYVVHPLSVTYGGTWKTEEVTFDGYIGLVQNLPWGGRGTDDYFEQAFDLTRPDPAVDYTILRYGFNKLVRLPQDLLVQVSANGQHAFNRLVPGEQFGLGGAASIRGYEEREEAYDAGFSGSLTFYSPDLAPLLLNNRTFQFRLCGFFDGGIGYNRKTQAGEDSSDTLKSVGAGLRLGVGEQFGFSLDWGHALDTAHSSQEPTRNGDNRIHVRAHLSF